MKARPLHLGAQSLTPWTTRDSLHSQSWSFMSIPSSPLPFTPALHRNLFLAPTPLHLCKLPITFKELDKTNNVQTLNFAQFSLGISFYFWELLVQLGGSKPYSSFSIVTMSYSHCSKYRIDVWGLWKINEKQVDCWGESNILIWQCHGHLILWDKFCLSGQKTGI